MGTNPCPMTILLDLIVMLNLDEELDDVGPEPGGEDVTWP